MNLAVPAIIGQAIDPVAQLLETAYIGRLVRFSWPQFSCHWRVSSQQYIKALQHTTLSIATSFVAEDVSRQESSHKRAVLLPPKTEDLDFVGYIKSGGLLLGRTLSVLITMTLATSMAARQGTLAMAAHQICLQVWLAVSLLSDALAVSAQALIASSFAKQDYKKVKEVTFYVLKVEFVGVTLALLLFASFGRLAELFSKDPMVTQIVGSGVLFVSASQPINALAFIFDGLHFGVSDFSYSASSMMVVGALSSLFLLYAPQIFGLPGVWAGLALFMSLRMTAGLSYSTKLQAIVKKMLMSGAVAKLQD
ncbi:hypothetical protein ACP70R_044597 [Stipagrostis hirtigluma subsp. patula]